MFKIHPTIAGGIALAALLPLAAPAAAADYAATAAVNPTSHAGSCPYKFTFKGVIRARRPGRVQYKWIRSDGANAPIQTLNFAAPGAKAVSTTWTLGGPTPTFRNFNGWQAIRIVYPQQVTSNRAAFRLRCAQRVTPPPRRRPDLVVRDIRLDSQCRIHVTIGNAGAGAVPNSAYGSPPNGAGVQMWRNGQPWGGIILKGFDPAKASQPPGGSATWTWFPGAANLKLGPGVHTLRVTVDNNNNVAESDEGNNTLTKRVRCRGGRPGGPGGLAPPPAPGKPDLGMYGFLKIGKNQREVKWGQTIVLTPADATLISGGKPAFEVYYSHREYANVAAPGPFKNKIFFNGNLVSQQTNLSLGPKEIKPIHTQAYLGPQNGQLSIRIDADNEVAETNEGNNGPFTVNLVFRSF